MGLEPGCNVLCSRVQFVRLERGVVVEDLNEEWDKALTVRNWDEVHLRNRPASDES
jgi:hypothetical protein